MRKRAHAVTTAQSSGRAQNLGPGLNERQLSGSPERRLDGRNWGALLTGSS